MVGNIQEGVDAAVTVLGDAVNFAARLQALAEPDTVLMSEATHRLMQGMVEASFAGEHTIKGKSELQKVFRLDGIRHGVTRFDVAVIRGLSSFVGREHELELLERGLTEARSELRVIDISAEPGMGKSRLLHEFRKRIGKERAFVLSGSCSRDGEQTPFLPFIEMVRGSFRVSTGEAEGDVASRLGAAARGLQPRADDALTRLMQIYCKSIPNLEASPRLTLWNIGLTCHAARWSQNRLQEPQDRRARKGEEDSRSSCRHMEKRAADRFQGSPR